MIRILELIVESVRARGSYLTRVWTALFLPVLAGTLFGWSFQTKLEGLFLGALVAVLYSIAQWMHNKYLR